MKSKIRCIYIDGMEKSGTTSIARELRRYLKNENKDLHEIKGVDIDRLTMQEEILSSDRDAFILKENSLLKSFYNDIKDNNTTVGLMYEKYEELILKEKNINNQYGTVHFFLMPTDTKMKEIWDGQQIPDYISVLTNFYNDINKISLSQGLDIRLISFDEYDKIYDVRDKILKLLTSDYII